MVSVTDHINRSIYESLELLKHSIKKLNHPANLDGLLCVHFDFNSQLEREFGWKVYCEPSHWLQENENNLHHAPSLAILGYLLSEKVDRSGNPDHDTENIFKINLNRLQQRQNVFSLPNSWVLQPEIVMGVTLGIKAVADTSLINWLFDLLKQGFNRSDTPLLLKLIYGYASAVLGNSLFHNLDVEPSKCSISELALAVWLVKRNFLEITHQDAKLWLDEAQAMLIDCLLTSSPYEAADYKAALIWEVAASYIEGRSRHATPDLVVTLLQNFPAAMERWKSKWIIEDEYDVQSLLWLILCSYFSDLRYEEYLPKLGRSGHRYDIAIPQLNSIIEAKFVREKKDFQKIVEEVGRDSAQLQPQSAFTNLIVFVYDKGCSIEQHAWACQALESIALVTRAIIVCAPSMCR